MVEAGTWLFITLGNSGSMKEVRFLVLKAKDSDASTREQHDAFAEIVRSFQDMAYATAYAILGDFQLAQDAAQEAFISAWRKLSQLREPEAFPGWFKQIVRTECNRLTRRKRPEFTSLELEMKIPSAFDCPQGAAERNEVKRFVHSAIEQLSENDRVALVLFYLEGQSQRDIATFLEVPVTTVSKRLYSARTRLAKLVSGDLKRDLMAHRPSRNSSFEEKVIAGIFDEYIGEYRYEQRPDINVVIKKEGNKLIGESNGQRNILWAHNDSENELLTKEFDGRGSFVRDADGRVTHFVYFEFGQEMGVAKKIS
jgi:RNA polymerase sigma factor (sigma-70 family)